MLPFYKAFKSTTARARRKALAVVLDGQLRLPASYAHSDTDATARWKVRYFAVKKIGYASVSTTKDQRQCLQAGRFYGAVIALS